MNEPQKRNGYQFVGWYIDKECTKRINPGGVLPHTMTLYDKWLPIWYPVRYECGKGVNSRKNPKAVNIESGAVLLYPARMPNMVFEGWFYKGKKVTTIPEGTCEPITLVAHFRKPAEVSFETGGGAIVQNKITNEDGKIEPFASPMRMGYEFDGWFWDAECRLAFDFDQTIEKNCVLYAGWKMIDYKIIYHTDGGFTSRMNPRSYTYYDPLITLLPAKKKGHEFIGWFDLRGNPLREIPKHSMGDKELVAHYRKVD